MAVRVKRESKSDKPFDFDFDPITRTMSSSSPFDRALSTLSSTAHSIFDTPVHRHSLPLASAGALSIIAFSYFWPNYPRSKENKSLPLLRKAPKGLKDDDIYPENIYEGSQYVDTPYGQVKTFQVGPTDGKKLLLVHGISTPAPIWKNVLGNLTKAGYRVLVYDLYGRGYSDSPSVPHDVALYTAQISFLLTANPDWEKFDICGMSLGGPIVCNFAHYFPQRIRKIFLICPAGGIPHNSVPIKTQIFSSLPFGLMQSLISISPINPVKDSKSIGAFQAKNHPGFFYSFLSSLSFGPIFGQASVMKEVCQNFGDKIQIVWGDKDDVVPLETKEYFAGNTKVNIIPGGGHWILATHGEDVSKYLIAHLDS